VRLYDDLLPVYDSISANQQILCLLMKAQAGYYQLPVVERRLHPATIAVAPELNHRVTVTGDEPLAGYCGVDEMWVGFTESQIFSCLTSGIHSNPALRDELNSKFPLKTNQINSQYAIYCQ
jgi:hypothetical protein